MKLTLTKRKEADHSCRWGGKPKRERTNYRDDGIYRKPCRSEPWLRWRVGKAPCWESNYIWKQRGCEV